MRRGMVVSVALVGGCFTELPMMPGTGSEATTSTASSGTGAGSTSGTDGTAATTVTGAPVSDTDVDPPTTGATTTAGPAAPEELFACVKKLSCAVWDCAGGCKEPGLEGTCVLAALRDRVAGPVEVMRCDEDCALHLVIVRGSGTDAAQWQWQVQAEPATYSELRTCTLKPPKFFADCLTNFGPECADPAAWLVDCALAEPACLSGA